MSDSAGICVLCESSGLVGTCCSEKICGKHGLCFIPESFAKKVLGRSIQGRDANLGTRIDDYLLVDELGAGGFGKVYLALQLPIGLKTALKLMLKKGESPDLGERLLKKFEGEARSLATLNHPNIVRLLKYGSHHGNPYMVMEFVEGGRTLRDELAARAQRGELFDAKVARHILAQLCNALQSAHAKSIVHRDIKSENIMLQNVEGDPNFVRVLDFGLAKFVEEEQHTSMVMGTPGYMAPEQLARSNIGPWTDVYAVGVLSFELLAGRRPFSGRTVQEIISKKLDPGYDPTSEIADLEIPRPVLDVLRRSVARDVDKRYRSARELSDALGRMFDQLGPKAEGNELGSLDAALSSGPLPVGATETLAPTQGIAVRSDETFVTAQSRATSQPAEYFAPEEGPVRGLETEHLPTAAPPGIAPGKGGRAAPVVSGASRAAVARSRWLVGVDTRELADRSRSQGNCQRQSSVPEEADSPADEATAGREHDPRRATRRQRPDESDTQRYGARPGGALSSRLQSNPTPLFRGRSGALCGGRPLRDHAPRSHDGGVRYLCRRWQVSEAGAGAGLHMAVPGARAISHHLRRLAGRVGLLQVEGLATAYGGRVGGLGAWSGGQQIPVGERSGRLHKNGDQDGPCLWGTPTRGDDTRRQELDWRHGPGRQRAGMDGESTHRDRLCTGEPRWKLSDDPRPVQYVLHEALRRAAEQTPRSRLSVRRRSVVITH